MKKLENNKVLYFIVNSLIYAGVAMIIFPGLDFLWDKFISNKAFEYTVREHIIGPIIFGIVYTILTMILDRKKKEK